MSEHTGPRIAELQQMQREFERIAREHAPERASRRRRAAALAIVGVLAVSAGVAGAGELIGGRDDPDVVDAASCANERELRAVFKSYGRRYPDEFAGRCPTADEIRDVFEASRYELGPADLEKLRDRIRERQDEGEPIPGWAEDL